MPWTAETISKQEQAGTANAIVGVRFAHTDGRTFTREVPSDSPASSIPGHVGNVLAALEKRDAELAALTLGTVTPPAPNPSLEQARVAANAVIRLKALRDSVAATTASAAVTSQKLTAAINRINLRSGAIIDGLADYLAANPNLNVEDLI